MTPRSTSEATPLLPQTTTTTTIQSEEKEEKAAVLHRSILEALSFKSQLPDDDVIAVPELPPFNILMEVIGCRDLLFTDAPNESNCHFETYCVIQYGLKTVHRTMPYRGHISSSNPSKAARIGKAFKQGLQKVAGGDASDAVAESLQNPIWTIQHDSLWTIPCTPKDFANHKAVVINVWARPLHTKTSLRVNSKRKSNQPKLVGKVRLHIKDLVSKCNEERVELQLVDELGRDVAHAKSTRVVNRDNKATVAFRCRIATAADFEFVGDWNCHPTSTTEVKRNIEDEVWQRAQVVVGENLQKRAVLLTELPEDQVQGASLSTAMKSTMGIPSGKVLIKPYPDPEKAPLSPTKRRWSPSKQQSSNSHMFMTPEQIKQETRRPSRKWVQAGNTKQSLGRLYVEILSAHDLPNVDLGETVGNKTNGFCSIVYGDTMVQTDLIDDELSPHWLPWTRRAFVFNVSNEWRNPSGVALFLGVFGFKRKPFRRHRAMGRVEIRPFSFQRNTLYELEYNIYKNSHATTRTAQGRIRMRLRLEIDDERTALLAPLSAMLSSPKLPSLYVNFQVKKTFACARYTACGEYDHVGKFQLGVLQGYIDEIVQGYVRRIVYALSDGARSLIFWQSHNQMQIEIAGGVVVFPLYSFLCFATGILVVECPHFLPGMLLCLAGMFMLVQLSHRNRSPNPWKRRSSFWRYLSILLWHASDKIKFEEIQQNEGWEEAKAEEGKLKDRIERDQKFLRKKEAVEKELAKVKQFKIESKSKDVIQNMELLVVLGKIQGIIGGKFSFCLCYATCKKSLTLFLFEFTQQSDFCRMLRFADAIVTWEEGDLAFFITLALLVVGVVFLLLPWAFLFRWTGRMLVFVLFGPQNRLLDVMYIQKRTDDERRLRLLFLERMFQARCKTEETAKLRAFRQTVFGKYSLHVPSILWTPHNDLPLPTSSAKYDETKMDNRSGKGNWLYFVTSQMLFGDIIPRPNATMKQNKQISTEHRESIEAVFELMKSNPHVSRVKSDIASSKRQREPSMLLDAGFEVTDLFDEEAQYVKDVLNPSSEESIHELGVEIMPNAATQSTQFLPVYTSVHEFPSDTMGNEDEASISSYSQDEGFEVTDIFDEEAQYVQDALKPPPQEESCRELGVEIMPDAATRSTQFIPAYKSEQELASDIGEKKDEANHSSISLDTAFEITDLFDREAQYVKNELKSPAHDESIHELGVEIMLDAATSSTQFIPAYRSVHEIPPDAGGCGDDANTSSSSEDDTDVDCPGGTRQNEIIQRNLLNESNRNEKMSNSPTLGMTFGPTPGSTPGPTPGPTPAPTLEDTFVQDSAGSYNCSVGMLDTSNPHAAPAPPAKAGSVVCDKLRAFYDKHGIDVDRLVKVGRNDDISNNNATDSASWRYVRLNPRFDRRETLQRIQQEAVRFNSGPNVEIQPVQWLNSTGRGNDSAVATLAESKQEEDPLSFYALPGDFRLAQSACYREGRIYGMDINSGAAVAALLSDRFDKDREKKEPKSNEYVASPVETIEAAESSQDLQPLRILDMCCAPGLKLCAIADYLSSTQAPVDRHNQNPSSTMANSNASQHHKHVVVGVDVSKTRLATCKRILHKYQVHPDTSGGDGSDTKARIRVYCCDGTTFDKPHLSNIGNKDDPPKHLPELIFDSTTAAEANTITGKRKRMNKSARARERKGLQSGASRALDFGTVVGTENEIVGTKTSAATIWKAKLFDKVIVDAECSTDGSLKHIQKQINKHAADSITTTASATEQSTTATIASKSSDSSIAPKLMNPEKLSELVQLQKQLAATGFRLLQPGGSMIYSTCSLSVQQNEAVVEWLLTCDEFKETAYAIPLSFSSHFRAAGDTGSSRDYIQEGEFGVRFNPVLPHLKTPLQTPQVPLSNAPTEDVGATQEKYNLLPTETTAAANSKDLSHISPSPHQFFGGGFFLAKIGKRKQSP